MQSLLEMLLRLMMVTRWSCQSAERQRWVMLSTSIHKRSMSSTQTRLITGASAVYGIDSTRDRTVFEVDFTICRRVFLCHRTDCISLSSALDEHSLLVCYPIHSHRRAFGLHHTSSLAVRIWSLWSSSNGNYVPACSGPGGMGRQLVCSPKAVG